MKDFDNLESFLEHVSLATSVDQEWDGEKINMMTMHAAKGLEFVCCIFTWMGGRVVPTPKIYRRKRSKWPRGRKTVSICRNYKGKEKAIISFSMNRFYQGDWIDSMASRFIDELPEKHFRKKFFFLRKKLTMIKILILIKTLKLKKEQEVPDGYDIKRELND